MGFHNNIVTKRLRSDAVRFLEPTVRSRTSVPVSSSFVMAGTLDLRLRYAFPREIPGTRELRKRVRLFAARPSNGNIDSSTISSVVSSRSESFDVKR